MDAAELSVEVPISNSPDNLAPSLQPDEYMDSGEQATSGASTDHSVPLMPQASASTDPSTDHQSLTKIFVALLQENKNLTAALEDTRKFAAFTKFHLEMQLEDTRRHLGTSQEELVALRRLVESKEKQRGFAQSQPIRTGSLPTDAGSRTGGAGKVGQE